MKHEELTRRRVLQSAAAGAAWAAWGFPLQPAWAAQAPTDLKILEPISGAVLNHRHGRQTSDGLTIRVDHIDSWVQSLRVRVPAPTKRVATYDLPPGSVRVVKPGTPGLGEVAYLVTRRADRSILSRTRLALRILRRPQPRVIATGISEYASLASLAKRGFVGTVRLAKAALSMVATAYTADCYGCSGWTKSGRHAGHGIVAVDPSVIPLGSHLYIPGYGKAIAGDTGGAIQGHRVDLGFNDNAAALQFGRRNIVVYVVK